MRGLIAADRGAFDDAIREYRRAQSFFERCHETEGELNAANLLADTLRVLGDFNAAWRVRLRILAQLDRLRPQRQEALLLATARLAEAQGLFGASLAFLNAAAAIALAADGPAAQAQILVRRAAALTELGDTSRARNDAGAVAKVLPSIGDANVRTRLEAELLVVNAGLTTDTGSAEAAINRALTFARDAKLLNYLPRLHLLLSHVRLAQGQTRGAFESLDHGIAALEAARLGTESSRLRVSFLDRSWDLFGEMVRLQLSAGQVDLAFDYAERARARTRTESLGADRQARASLGDLASAVPNATAFLYYVLLEDRAIVWAIADGHTHLVSLNESGAELNQHLRAFQRQLRTGEPVRTESEHLYDVLLRPTLAALPPVNRLIIAADGELSAIPFAALRRRETDRYLLEDFVIESTPNGTVWLRSNHTEFTASASARVTVLSASAPLDIDLPVLPAADLEARDIAKLYPAARYVRDATKVDFLDALRSEGILHFAGHAIPNIDYPELSRIVLEHDANHSGVIYAEELSASGGFRADLVVLSACSTASGPLSRGEGPISLARPLLIGGVRAVIASLWEVRDTATRELMVRVHQEISRGSPVGRALRAAQLQMLVNRDPSLASPSNWAAFVVF
jgi:CHAT domain-containing protein